MNYSRIYYELIAARKLTPPSGYSEVHHIIPKSLGGPNTKDNLVRLSGREHFIAHLLLTRMYTGYKQISMLAAFNIMLNCSRKYQSRYKPSVKYSKLRELFATSVSIRSAIHQKGVGNSQHGKCWVTHELFGAKAVPRDLIVYYIDQGWIKGRTLRIAKTARKKHFKIPLTQIREMHDLYIVVGFNEFVKRTGYARSQANLVAIFKRHIENFVPCMGKKRRA